MFWCSFWNVFWGPGPHFGKLLVSFCGPGGLPGLPGGVPGLPGATQREFLGFWDEFCLTPHVGFHFGEIFDVCLKCSFNAFLDAPWKQFSGF